MTGKQIPAHGGRGNLKIISTLITETDPATSFNALFFCLQQQRIPTNVTHSWGINNLRGHKHARWVLVC